MPGELVPQQGPDWEPALRYVKEIIQPLADADKHRSDNDTARYQRWLESWDHGARQGHLRFLALLGAVLLVVLVLLGFSFYAYATGSPAVATHTITAVLSFLGGIAAGMGLRRTQ